MANSGRFEEFFYQLGRLGRVLIYLGILFFPLPSLIALIIYYIFKRNASRRYSSIFIALFGIVIFALSVIIKKKIDFSELCFLRGLGAYLGSLRLLSDDKAFNVLFYVKSWLFSFNLLSYGLSWIMIGLGIFSLTDTDKEKEVKAQIADEKGHKESKGKVLDLDSQKHLFAAGTTGSGKTANILHYIDDNLKNNGFSVIVDGKGALGKYDLGTVTQQLAKKYNRKIYILNQTDIENTDPYNPFRDLTATQVKDFLINMSDWESDHYKNLASRYWQLMANVMITCGLKVNFESIIYFSFTKNFLGLIDTALKEEKISEETYILAESLANGSSGKQAEMSIGRSAVIYEGDGNKIFGGSDSWSIRSAYEENAIVLVLLNEFNYSEFARSTGKLVIDDLKALIGKLQREQQLGHDSDRKILLVLEELGVYVDDGIEGLLNRSRSVGAKSICSVQTTADIDKINPDLTRQIMGNCNDFLIMRIIDPDSAEYISKMIGTRKKQEQTRRTTYGEDTGESSNKIIDKFILSPNEIKNLPDLVGFYYSKSKPNIVRKFKTEFVEV